MRLLLGIHKGQLHDGRVVALCCVVVKLTNSRYQTIKKNPEGVKDE